VRGIEHVLEVAREQNLRLYAPSSIAAFGPSTPQVLASSPSSGTIFLDKINSWVILGNDC
jgi:hypothetical protein